MFPYDVWCLIPEYALCSKCSLMMSYDVWCLIPESEDKKRMVYKENIYFNPQSLLWNVHSILGYPVSTVCTRKNI